MWEYVLKFCGKRISQKKKYLGLAEIRTHNLPLSRQMLLPLKPRWQRSFQIGVGEAQAVNLSLSLSLSLSLKQRHHSSCAALPCREVPGRSYFHANPTRELWLGLVARSLRAVLHHPFGRYQNDLISMRTQPCRHHQVTGTKLGPLLSVKLFW